MKVLSLFDGISCARVALERAGIAVEAYYASEIEEEHLGTVFSAAGDHADGYHKLGKFPDNWESMESDDIKSTCNCSDIVVGPGGDLGGYMGHKRMCAVSVEYRKGNKEKYRKTDKFIMSLLKKDSSAIVKV